jgi:hypothetical protein
VGNVCVKGGEGKKFEDPNLVVENREGILLFSGQGGECGGGGEVGLRGGRVGRLGG